LSFYAILSYHKKNDSVMKIFPTPYAHLSIWLTIFFGSLGGIPANGQEAFDGGLIEEMDYFTLEEFEVVAEDQTGYLVTNSTSGTRLNQPVAELPMPIEIISNDFIEDTGAKSLDAALAFNNYQSIYAEDFMVPEIRPGQFTAIQVIPERSHFSSILGLLALAWVASRRRKRVRQSFTAGSLV
jgi:hypothetical protein